MLLSQHTEDKPSLLDLDVGTETLPPAPTPCALQLQKPSLINVCLITPLTFSWPRIPVIYLSGRILFHSAFTGIF